MGIALSLVLPLAAVSMAADAPANPETSSARFANVLVTSYVCEHLGFSVDYDGLADWGDRVSDSFVAAGASPDNALARVRRDVRTERDRFNRFHGGAVWQAGLAITGVGAGADAQYRFQKTFMDRCSAIARSQDAGAYFTAPENRMSGAELSRKTRALIIQARAGV